MFPYDKTKLGKKIAEGFYATIHEYGEQIEGKRNHLVKCLPAKDMTKLRQYQEEFALGFNNKHPFVLNYKGLYTEEVNEKDKKYMVYIKMVKMKQTLRGFIEEAKILKQNVPKEKVIWIFFSLASALSYLEDKDIVHSNIMYDSVFFEESGTVKLGGFAFSKYKPWNRPEIKVYQSYAPPEEGYQPPKEEKKPLKKGKKNVESEEKDDGQLDGSFDLFGEEVKEKKEEPKEKEKDEKEEKKEDEQLEEPFNLFDEEEVKLNEKDIKKDESQEKKKDEVEEKRKRKAAKALAFKKDVWCLGKLIIDICLLQNEIKREKYVDDINRKVEEDIEKVHKKYQDPELKKILEDILKAERTERPTFRQIFEDLQKKYPHLRLLEMENKKEKEKPINLDLSGVKEAGPEERKVEDENNILPPGMEVVIADRKEISEAQKTIDDLQLIKQNIENMISNFRENHEKSAKDLAAIVNNISEYKLHPQISKEDVSELNKAEIFLMDCYTTPFESIELNLQKASSCFGKTDIPQDIAAPSEEHKEEITDKNILGMKVIFIDVKEEIAPNKRGIFQSNNITQFGHHTFDAQQGSSVENYLNNLELYPTAGEEQPNG